MLAKESRPTPVPLCIDDIIGRVGWGGAVGGGENGEGGGGVWWLPEQQMKI